MGQTFPANPAASPVTLAIWCWLTALASITPFTALEHGHGEIWVWIFLAGMVSLCFCTAVTAGLFNSYLRANDSWWREEESIQKYHEAERKRAYEWNHYYAALNQKPYQNIAIFNFVHVE